MSIEMNSDSLYIVIVLAMLIIMFWNILPGYAASARATVTIISSVVVEPDPESGNRIKIINRNSANYSITLDPSENGSITVVNFE